MEEDLPILYVKTGCSDSAAAVDFMDSHGVDHREMNITNSKAALAELKRKSGRTETPTLDWHGTVLAGVTLEDLREFLLQSEVRLEDS